MIGGLEGNASDHAALLRALVPLLQSFYRRRVHGGDDDIQDLVQETLIAIHTRRGTFDRKRRFTSWLYAIARYKMIDHFRRTRRLIPIEDLDETLVADSLTDASDAQMDLDSLLATLPAKQATAIRATRLDGKSIAEAAEDSGIGVSDVKVSVHRGLKKLTTRVQDAS